MARQSLSSKGSTMSASNGEAVDSTAAAIAKTATKFIRKMALKVPHKRTVEATILNVFEAVVSNLEKGPLKTHIERNLEDFYKMFEQTIATKTDDEDESSTSNKMNSKQPNKTLAGSDRKLSNDFPFRKIHYLLGSFSDKYAGIRDPIEATASITEILANARCHSSIEFPVLAQTLFDSTDSTSQSPSSSSYYTSTASHSLAKLILSTLTLHESLWSVEPETTACLLGYAAVTLGTSHLAALAQVIGDAIATAVDPKLILGAMGMWSRRGGDSTQSMSAEIITKIAVLLAEKVESLDAVALRAQGRNSELAEWFESTLDNILHPKQQQVTSKASDPTNTGHSDVDTVDESDIARYDTDYGRGVAVAVAVEEEIEKEQELGFELDVHGDHALAADIIAAPLPQYPSEELQESGKKRGRKSNVASASIPEPEARASKEKDRSSKKKK